MIIDDPVFDPDITGCGAPCGKVFDACKHPCTQLCHSGVCALCQTEVCGMCPEGVHELSRKCSEKFPKCRTEVIIRCPADRHDLVRECSSVNSSAASARVKESRRSREGAREGAEGNRSGDTRASRRVFETNRGIAGER